MGYYSNMIDVSIDLISMTEIDGLMAERGRDDDVKNTKNDYVNRSHEWW